MIFWQVFVALCGLAALFILWPVIFVGKQQKKALRSEARTEYNSEVFEQHISELESTRGRGEINEEQYLQLKEDLEKTRLQENLSPELETEQAITASFKSRIPVMCLIVAIPVLAILIYGQIGAKADWHIYELSQARLETTTVTDRKTISETLVVALQDRLEDAPENVQNWYLLAHTAVDVGQRDEGVRAYRKLVELQPNAPMLKADLAQALFLQAGNVVTPEVRKYAHEALAKAPNLPTALGLAGVDAYHSGKYQEAIDYWRRAVVQLDPRSTASQVLSTGIARAQAALSSKGETVSVNTVEKSKKSGGESKLSLEVKVDLDSNKVSTAKDAGVFIYARAWQGPRMPLAIRRLTVADLPATITLDETMAMTQGMDLSRFPQVEIVARVSASGSAISSSGDWQASVGPVVVKTHKEVIDLTIADQLP